MLIGLNMKYKSTIYFLLVFILGAMISFLVTAYTVEKQFSSALWLFRFKLYAYEGERAFNAYHSNADINIKIHALNHFTDYYDKHIKKNTLGEVQYTDIALAYGMLGKLYEELLKNEEASIYYQKSLELIGQHNLITSRQVNNIDALKKYLDDYSDGLKGKEGG